MLESLTLVCSMFNTSCHEVCMDACMEHGIPCFSVAWQIIQSCSTAAMAFYILSSSHDLHGPDSRGTQLTGIKGLEHFLQHTASTMVAMEFDSQALLEKKSIYNLLISSYWCKCQIMHLLLKDSYFQSTDFSIFTCLVTMCIHACRPEPMPIWLLMAWTYALIMQRLSPLYDRDWWYLEFR